MSPQFRVLVETLPAEDRTPDISPSCPNKAELIDFAVGRLTADSAEQLNQHLTECSDCCETIDAMAASGDTLLDALRGPDTVDDFLSEPELLDRLGKIGRMEPSEDVDQEADSPGFGKDTLLDRSEDFGNYRLISKLGQGGMGAVYKAVHTSLDKVVAIKVLASGKLHDASAIKRFQREMKAIGRVQHPNVVVAHDAGEIDGHHYLVMEFVDGFDVSELASTFGDAAGRLPIGVATEIIRQAAIGIQHAHDQGLIHRDIKPSNLMLDQEGNVKVLDLGLARVDPARNDALTTAGAANNELTASGTAMGTIGYMSPEQALDSTNVDPRTDVYSLGATLYKLLSGHLPFSTDEFDTAGKMLVAIATNTPMPVRKRRATLPAELGKIVDNTLAREPRQRVAPASELARKLEPFAKADLAEFIRDLPADRLDKEASPAAATLEATVLAPTPPQRNHWAAVALLFLLPLAFFAIQFLIRTENGMVLVEIEDEQVEAKLKASGIEVVDQTNNKVWTINTRPSEARSLPQGKYQFRPPAGLVITDADGLEISANEFKLVNADKQLRIRVSIATDEPKATKEAEFIDFIKQLGGTVKVGDMVSSRQIADKDRFVPDEYLWIYFDQNPQFDDADVKAFVRAVKALPPIVIRHLEFKGTRVSAPGLLPLKALRIDYLLLIDSKSDLNLDTIVNDMIDWPIYGWKVGDAISGEALQTLAKGSRWGDITLSTSRVVPEQLQVVVKRPMWKLELEMRPEELEKYLPVIGKAIKTQRIFLHGCTRPTEAQTAYLRDRLPNSAVFWNDRLIVDASIKDPGRDSIKAKLVQAGSAAHQREIEAAKWIDSVGGKYFAGGPGAQPTDIALIEATPGSLRFIDLSGVDADRIGQHLKDLPNLGILFASNTNLSSKDIPDLLTNTKLYWLKLANTKLKSSELPPLEALTRLNSLGLNCNQVDDDWEFVNRMPWLPELQLESDSVPDFEKLSRFKGFDTIWLGLDYAKVEMQEAEVLKLAATAAKQNPHLRIGINGKIVGRDPVYATAKMLAKVDWRFQGAHSNWKDTWDSAQKDAWTQGHWFHVREISAPADLVMTPEIVDQLPALGHAFGTTSFLGATNIKLLPKFLRKGSIRHLNLAGSDLDDNTLLQLASISVIEKITVTNSRVTRAGAEAFHRLRDDCDLIGPFIESDRNAKASGNTFDVYGKGSPVPIANIDATEYEMQFMAERNPKARIEGLGVKLEVDGHPVLAVFGGWEGKWTALEEVDGKAGDVSETRIAMDPFADGKPHHFRIKVTKSSIKTWIDDKPSTSWEGDAKRLSTNDYFARGATLQFRTFQGARFKVSQFELTPQIDHSKDLSKVGLVGVQPVGIANDVPEAYQLELTAKRSSQKVEGLGIRLKIGDRSALAVFGGWGGKLTALESVDGKLGPANETRVQLDPFADGKSHRIRIQVDKGSIQGWVDDLRIINWSGDPQQLWYDVLPGESPVYLTTFQGAEFQVSDLRLSPLAVLAGSSTSFVVETDKSVTVATESPAEYELKFKVKRDATTGRSLLVHLPVVDNRVMMIFAGYMKQNWTGLQLIDGKRPAELKETSVHLDPFADNQFHEVSIKVTSDSVNAWVDGKPVVEWSGDVTRLSTEDWGAKHGIVIQAGYSSRFQIKDLHLRDLNDAQRARTEKPDLAVVPFNPEQAEAHQKAWATHHGSDIETPAIDSIAQQGMRLERFYVNPICTPTRAALLTGRDALRMGVGYFPIMAWSNKAVSQTEHFMPESFQAAGYQTGMVGKWHLGHTLESHTPNARGFDDFFGHLHTQVFYFTHKTSGGHDLQHNGQSVRRDGKYMTDVHGDEAARF
ncbi:MAG: protein kinase, partial [Rubripirellula sp.]